LIVVCDSVERTFTDLICASIDRRDLEISPLAESYVVKVVSGFTTETRVVQNSIYLNDLLREALDSDGITRVEYLRLAGDTALFVCGIFPDSLESRHNWFNLGDYIDIGQKAYDYINNEIFDELAIKFPEIVEALNDVSIEVDLTSTDVVKYIKRRSYIDVRTTRR
jgi:hypothetical protein